jgi:branched-chain amino acid transport system ATP-binding protein
MLELVDVRARHGAVEAVRGVSLQLQDGRVLAIVGPNGAGKTTLARAVAGLHQPREGVVRTGTRDLSTSGAVATARAGVSLVPQGRRLFASLTVAEHLTIARRSRQAQAMSREDLLELFPNLGRRLKVRARSLSGGEQQMLAIARAVLPGPDVLIMDEPTEGLAPAVVDLVGNLIAHQRAHGVSVLLMEQQGRFAFDVADEVLAMDRGVLLGAATPPTEAPTRQEVRR